MVSLKVAEKIRVLRHLHTHHALLVENKMLENHPTLGMNIKLLRSFLRSLIDKGYVKEIYVWNHSYNMLTETGMEYLKEELEVEDSLEMRPIIEEITVKE